MAQRRWLFLSNLYPPEAQGGYEHLCQQVAVELTQRGDQVAVVTGCVAGEVRAWQDSGVFVNRIVELEVDGGLLSTLVRLLLTRELSERRSVRRVEAVVRQMEVDAALVWGMWNVPRAVPAAVERLLPGAVGYYLCDYWPTLPNAYIQRLSVPARRRTTVLPKRMVAGLLMSRLRREAVRHLDLSRSVCVSRALRNILVSEGVPIANATIVHLGVREVPVTQARADASGSGVLRLICAGRLSPEKGVHTAIEAMEIVGMRGRGDISLDVFGSGPADYVVRLTALAQKTRIPITFHGRVEHSKLLGALPTYDAFLFCSEWQEPFAHAVLEAMAAGLPVIGTTTGGTGEVLVDEETGLTFAAGSADELAGQIIRLAESHSLRTRLAAHARTVVARDFTLSRTVVGLERFLMAMAENTRRGGS